MGFCACSKTAVFVLATLNQLVPVDGEVSVIVLCHARELAFQIGKEYDRFSKYLPGIKTAVLYGGAWFALGLLDWGCHLDVPWFPRHFVQPRLCFLLWLLLLICHCRRSFVWMVCWRQASRCGRTCSC